MTNRHLEYVLDRLLSRETSIPGPTVDTTYRFNGKASGITNVDAVGRWFLDGVNLYVYEEDADGVALPVGGSLTLVDTSIVHIVAGSYNLATPLLAYQAGLNPLGQALPDTRRLELAMSPAIVGGDFTISIPTGQEQTTIMGTKKVWCTRLDFRGRDQINITNFANFTLADTRIIVRNDGSWDTMDTFTLDGDTFTVRGVAKVGGRGRFLELLARGG